MLWPVAPQGFLSQEGLLKDAAKVELLVLKVPKKPTSFLAECYVFGLASAVINLNCVPRLMQIFRGWLGLLASMFV